MGFQNEILKLFKANNWQVLRYGKGSHLIVVQPQNGLTECIPSKGCEMMKRRFIKKYNLK
ncbi:MAG: hypothetical protein WCO84_00910 [bacterium]